VPLFADANPANVAPNTPMDIQRFQNDLAALTPGNQLQLLTTGGIAKDFRNGGDLHGRRRP
jgi:hypothetical protein